MPTPKKGPRLASSPAHERLMLANMATSLFQHGRITTTLPKAKSRRPPPLKLRLRRPPRPLPRRPPTRPSETRLIDIDRGWEP